MTVKRTTILSCASADCPRPWVELEDFKVTKQGIQFGIRKLNGPAAAEWVKADHAKERRLERGHTFAFDPEAEQYANGLHEPHALAITVEGDLIFVPFSKQPPILYAHLAFVDTDTLDAEVLEFVPEPIDPLPALTAHVEHLERELADRRAAEVAKEKDDG